MIIVVGSTVISQYSMNTPNVYASGGSPYDTGREHGCDDAGRSESDKYINQHEKGPSFHTNEFMNGYYAGLNACSSGESNRSDESQPPSSQQGGIDWNKTCNDLQTALVSSCEVLVNPDNTLTTEGERAVGCIRNGIALAGGGSLLLSLPLPLVVTALQILEEPTGCGGIVEWGLIGEVGGLKGIINRLA